MPVKTKGAEMGSRVQDRWTSRDLCSKRALLYCSRNRLRSSGHDKTAPNCHAGRKPEWDLCAELCYSAQGHSSDKARQHCSGILCRQSGREREAPLRQEVLHFRLSSESHLVTNIRVLQHVTSSLKLHNFRNVCSN